MIIAAIAPQRTEHDNSILPFSESSIEAFCLASSIHFCALSSSLCCPAACVVPNPESISNAFFSCAFSTEHFLTELFQAEEKPLFMFEMQHLKSTLSVYSSISGSDVQRYTISVRMKEISRNTSSSSFILETISCLIPTPTATIDRNTKIAAADRII